MEGLASLEKKAFLGTVASMIGKGLIGTGKIGGSAIKGTYKAGKFAFSPVSSTVNAFKKPLADGAVAATKSKGMIAADAVGGGLSFGGASYGLTRGSRMANIEKIQRGFKTTH